MFLQRPGFGTHQPIDGKERTNSSLVPGHVRNAQALFPPYVQCQFVGLSVLTNSNMVRKRSQQKEEATHRLLKLHPGDPSRDLEG